MLTYPGIILGIVLLIGGGAGLVAGSSQIANRFGISPMIIGFLRNARIGRPSALFLLTAYIAYAVYRIA